MKKFGMVLGAAAVAVVAGCKDPDFRRASQPVQDEVKNAAPVETAPAPAEEVAVVPAATPKCTCAPGTRHTEPCACGAADCACIVTPKAVSVESEATIYIVQNGDYLAKISKRFNVTIPAIKRLNGLKSDLLRVGQKLKLPGKIDVGAQTAPVAPKAAKSSPKVVRVTTVFTGATKEYVVKNGDTLGAIAYERGITIRQLKSMNGLKSDALKLGQKLKVPAEKVVKAKKAPSKSDAPATPAEQSVKDEKQEDKAPVVDADSAPVTDAAPAPAVEAAPSAAPAAPAASAPEPAVSAAAVTPATFDYKVLEGEDITAVVVKFGVTAADIRTLNNLGETDSLTAGQVIKLPAEAQQ